MHLTQKPLDLMKALIELSTQKGQVVLDPFCGSGTSLLAAKLLQRHYIGIELDPQFFETANTRVKNNGAANIDGTQISFFDTKKDDN